MLFSLVEGRSSSCEAEEEEGAKPDDEEIEQNKRRKAANCTAEGGGIDNLRTMLVGRVLMMVVRWRSMEYRT